MTFLKMLLEAESEPNSDYKPYSRKKKGFSSSSAQQ